MDDIKQKRPSIRDLQLDRPSSGAGSRERRMPVSDGAEDSKAFAATSHSPHKRGMRLGWWVLAVVLLVAASVISLPIVFSDTTINIKPVVTRAIFTDAVFNAFKSSTEPGSTEVVDTLSYSVVEWSVEESEVLEPTRRQEVKEKASGIITVYNEYTTSRQRLIKNTRFETSDGHVYRVRESIMVPGKTGSTPGTLDVRVYADEAGEPYNVASGSMTLPGLKSLPDMYTDIYAKIKTPITGGFSGDRAIVSEASQETASKALRARVEARVAEEVESRIPEDTRHFASGITINFADTISSEIDGKVSIGESAAVQVIVFNKVDFASALALGVAGNPSSGYPTVRDISKLSITVDTQDEETIDGQSVKIVVNGDADFVWGFNQSELIQDLAGKEREAFTMVLKGYPTIDNGTEAIIRPFWRSTFPKNINDFTIVILDVE